MFFNWFFTEKVQPVHRKQNEGDLGITVLSFSSVAPLIILLLPFLYSKEITSHWLFFLAAMRFINSSAQRFRRLGFKTSFVNCYLGAAFEWPIHCERCVKSAAVKTAAKTAVLPLLSPETAGCLQSIMPTPISHMWMQCHPNAAWWIPGLQANVLSKRVWALGYSRNYGSFAQVKRHCVPPHPLLIPKFSWEIMVKSL